MAVLHVDSKKARASASVEAVIAAVSRQPEPAILDSADATSSRGRYTIVACNPVCSLAWDRTGADPFEAMRDELTRLPEQITWHGESSEAARAFPGGWIGYFAYEAGRFIERLPATVTFDVGLPVARFGLYDSAAVFDARTGTWTLVAADLRPFAACPGWHPCHSPEEQLDFWEALLDRAVSPHLLALPLPSPSRQSMSQTQYLNLVRRAKEYIAAGDIFQVNLARRETFPVREPAIQTYLRLRQTNPGAYAAYLSWGQMGSASTSAVLCSSPELFLEVKGRQIITRPIKGTRPRHADPVLDAVYRDELAVSVKDRAELAMIVDLERNDLGRVCEFGSIHVTSPVKSNALPYYLATHPTVHHLVAEVVGTLAPSCDQIDLLRACFPGGSITGAPKIRAMEIIDELEPTERSVYTGAIGFFGLDKAMTFNIAIRTIIVANEELHVYAGGGIVADSDPQAEYEETLAKQLGMIRAVNPTAAVYTGREASSHRHWR